MKENTQWVVGFLFRNGREVALISKTHPEWQAGKLNGVGGKINEGESPEAAMRREFLEEAGVEVPEWKEFALLKVQDGNVHCFAAHGDYEVQSVTDEKIGWYEVDKLGQLPVIYNLRWLITLALDPGNTHAVINYFQSHES